MVLIAPLSDGTATLAEIVELHMCAVLALSFNIDLQLSGWIDEASRVQVFGKAGFRHAGASSP